MIRARDARKFLEAHKRLDIAIDAYYNNPTAFSNSARRKGDSSAPSTSKLGQLFDKYKGWTSHDPFLSSSIIYLCNIDPDEGDITIDGTIKFCEDLEVDPEDVVLLAVAFELKSPRLGHWTRTGWVEGWKSIGSVTCLKFMLSSSWLNRFTILLQSRFDTKHEKFSNEAEDSTRIRSRIFPESVQPHV